MNSSGQPALTPMMLFKGAFFAAEQCGHLYNAAVRLYESSHFSSAVVLALLGREELGRAFILLDFWRRARLGEQIKISEVRRAYLDHSEKQRQGQVVLGFRKLPTGSKGIDELLNKLSTLPYATDEWNAAYNEVESVVQRKGKSLSEEHHRLRQSALYVELNDTGTEWKRPSSIGRDRARTILEEVSWDYGFASEWIGRGKVPRWVESRDDPGLDHDILEALAAWTERPILPADDLPS